MAKYISSIMRFRVDFYIVTCALGLHLWYLLHTTFVDWPEMLVYPWFLTKGLVYYRDIVLAYVPGAYYVLYALYKVFGFTTLAERGIAYGLIGVTDLLIYMASRRLTSSRLIAGASLLFFIIWQPIFSGNTIWYETILAPIYVATYILVLRYIDKSTILRMIPIAIMCAIASLIKQTAIWPISVVVLFVWLTHTQKRTGFIHACIIGAAPVLANLGIWGYFAFLGAGREYVYWSYGFLTALTKSDSYYMMLPGRSDIMLIAPALIPLGLFFLLRHTRDVWFIFFWSMALLMAGLPRWGIHRLQPLLAFSSLGFGVMVHDIIKLRKASPHLFLYVFFFAIIGLGSWRSFRVFVTIRDHMQPQFFGEEFRQLAEFGKANMSEPYYVLGNYDYLYYKTDTKPAVLPWVPLFPWNAQVSGMQTRLIQSIDTQKINYILYIPFHPESGYYLDYAPQELMLYISQKYEKIRPLPIKGGWLYQRK